MFPSDLELLRHIYDEVDFILKTISGKSKDELVTDPILSRAVIRSLEIVGEAATKISDEFKATYPHIEWRKMSATRNRLIHDYFGVDYDIIWSIIETKLPDLKDNIADIFDSEKL